MQYSVKYKGERYKVSFKDKIYVERIKAILFLKRVVRRARLFVPKNLKLYLLLSLCWVGFGIITYYFGKWYKSPAVYTVVDVIWELKNSYFTSVFLALFISGYNQSVGYKDKLIKQHSFYYDTMHEFEKLFAPFLGSHLYYYLVFYNSLCLEQTLEFINNMQANVKLDMREFAESVDDILNQLDKVEEKRKSDCIIGMHNDRLMDEINCAQRTLRVLRKAKSKDDVIKELDALAWTLFYIVADIRRPWRWDIDNDKKILFILSKYECNCIEEDFYNRMHLYGHKLIDIQE